MLREKLVRPWPDQPDRFRRPWITSSISLPFSLSCACVFASLSLSLYSCFHPRDRSRSPIEKGTPCSSLPPVSSTPLSGLEIGKCRSTYTYDADQQHFSHYVDSDSSAFFLNIQESDIPMQGEFSCNIVHITELLCYIMEMYSTFLLLLIE